jgi:hypothetical protein
MSTLRARSRLLTMGVAVSAVCLVACKRHNHDPGPFSLKWPSTTSFVAEGNGDTTAVLESRWTGEASTTGSKMFVRLSNVPTGTHWQAGGKQGDLQGTPGDSIDLGSYDDQIGAIKIADFHAATVQPPSPVVFLLPSGQRLEVPLPKLQVGGLDNLMARAEHGPLLFGGEQATSGAIHGIYRVVGMVDATKEIVGSPSTLRDIDAVALQNTTYGRDKKTCNYGDMSGSVQTTRDAQLGTTEVKIIERRTGKLLATRTFPNDRCPGAVAEMEHVKAEADSAAIEAWVAAQIAP